MLEKLFEDGETFELKGKTFQITSVGTHVVDEIPAGFSYAFRLKEEIDSDHEAQERHERIEAERQAKMEEEAKAAESEEESTDSKEGEE